MDDAEMARLQAEAAREIAWEQLRKLIDPIKRIGDGEFDGSEFDANLIRMMAHVILGELEIRRLAIEYGEDNVEDGQD